MFRCQFGYFVIHNTVTCVQFCVHCSLQILVLSIALLAALFMSFTVGANSNSAPVAPAVGANALSVLRAAFLVGIVAGLGAILQSYNLKVHSESGSLTRVKATTAEIDESSHDVACIPP